MNQFTIRDIENLSGIKAHTLRIWEQRYNILIPKRRESNHRFYDNEDLKQILRISYLYHNGLKISRIAKLENGAIQKMLSDVKTGNSYEYFVSQLMEASIDFDEDKFEDVLNTALRSDDLENVVLNVVYPFLNKIGLLWVTDHIIPAQEHFSSNIILRKFLVAIDELRQENNQSGKVVLLFTPQREHHEISLLFIQYLLKKNGHKVVYFGDNVPVKDIELYCIEKEVTHLHFHLITNFVEKELDAYVLDLAKKFSAYNIAMSGPSVNAVKVHPENVRLLYSMDEILRYAKE
jgi:DNA-binding transcriptional MerR regulator